MPLERDDLFDYVTAEHNKRIEKTLERVDHLDQKIEKIQDDISEIKGLLNSVSMVVKFAGVVVSAGTMLAMSWSNIVAWFKGL